MAGTPNPTSHTLQSLATILYSTHKVLLRGVSHYTNETELRGAHMFSSYYKRRVGDPHHD